MRDRLTLLHEWLYSLFDTDNYRLAPASEDASFRRYYRVSVADQTFIVMDAPPEHEDIEAFVRITHRLAAHVNVPAIHQSDMTQGFLLLTDLGDRRYLENLNAKTAKTLYQDAINALARMQIAAPAADLEAYNETRLQTEMDLFNDWLLKRHLGVDLASGEAEALEKIQAQLILNALEQPRVFVHRDYHSRNLMQTRTANPGVLDYQGAVQGPLAYDLVSLLKDCYIKWPEQEINRWLNDYLAQLKNGRPAWVPDKDRFKRWFDLMGVQRHLKASGLFARLSRRDGKHGFLGDIPRTLSYIIDLKPAYPELAPLCRIIETRILPGLGRP